MLQRADVTYEQERNEGDILEAQKWFKAIKKNVSRTDEQTPHQMFTIWEVALSALPEKVRALINRIREAEITTSSYFWETDYELYPRDFHSNVGGHLPESDPSGLEEGTKGYAYRGLTEEHQVDKRGRRAQYAEYHITESGLGKAFRLLYDYVNNVFYISISHYNIWDEEKPPFFRVDVTK